MPGWASLAIALTVYVVLMVFLGLNASLCETPVSGDLNRFIYRTLALCWVR